MAEIRHIENRHDVIFFCRGWSDLDKISETGAEWQVNCGDVVEIETRCRIPIWRTFGRIQYHVISEPPATLQGAATWRIQCHDPRVMCVTLQGAVTWWIHCQSWLQTHMPHCSVQSPGEINVVIVPHCIRHIENHFSQYFLFLFFKMQSGLWRAAAFVSYLIHLFYTVIMACQ